MSNSISLKFSIGQLPLAVFHILLPIMIGSYTYRVSNLASEFPFLAALQRSEADALRLR